MAEIPEIIDEWPQPITGTKVVHKVPSTAQHIGFYAYGDGKKAEFTVLAGAGSPTLTGGWVKIAKIPRYQRLSITVPEGYDPYVLTIPIMFDATVGDQEKGGRQVEARIKTLEWMAGREVHPSTEIMGEPPYVEVFTYQGTTRTNLIPTQYQSVPGSEDNDTSETWKAILSVNPRLGNNPEKKLKLHTAVKYPESILKQVPSSEVPLWYITGITYDPNPLRVRGGDRIRQNVTVELTQIVLSQSALSRAENESAANSKKFGTFKATSTVNTVKKIAVHLTKGRK